MGFLVRLGALLAFIALLFVYVVPWVSSGAHWGRRDGPELAVVTISELAPAPWLVPKNPGGPVLRLAMVHDVLHERYLRHGTAWYESRQRLAAAALAATDEHGPDQAHALALLDDLAVGCERLGRPEEGIPFARRKLAVQQPGLGPQQAAADIRYYTTYANLGTLLIHANLAKAIAGDVAALGIVREGAAWIRLAMQANPAAHFGREEWQLKAVEFIVAAIADPQRLFLGDIVGIKATGRNFGAIRSGYGKTYLAMSREYAEPPPAGGDAEERAALADLLRKEIPSYLSSGPGIIPFDQPTLGLIGLWTLGGGANPHFALALGHLMELVRQRHTAWNAYERATELSAKWWPDPAVREQLVAMCRSRQTALARELGEDPERLRAAHQHELADGQRRQREFQAFEEARLAAGADPYHADFYSEFSKDHAAIATPPGDEDLVAVEVERPWWAYAPFAVGGASMAALFVLSMAAYRRQVRREWRAPNP